MARIPIFPDVGQRIAPIIPGPREPVAGAGAIGEAVSRAGAIAGNIAGAEQQREMQMDERAGQQRDRLLAAEIDEKARETLRVQREEEAERRRVEADAKTARLRQTALTYYAEGATIADQVTAEVRAGRVPRDTAASVLDQRLGELRTMLTTGFDATTGLPQLTTAIQERDITFRRGFGQDMTRLATEERVGSLTASLEQLERIGMRNPDDAISRAAALMSTEGVAVLGADRATAQLAKFREGVIGNYWKRRLVDSPDDARSLGVLATQIKGDDRLDPGTATALLATVESRQAAAQQRALVAAERIGRDNERAFSAAASVVQAGKLLDPTLATQLSQRFRGTAFEGAFRSLVSAAPAQVAFSSQPLSSQERALFDLQKKGNTVGWTPAEQKQYETLNKAHEETLREVRVDPWKAGLERGVIPQVQPLTLDLATLPAQLAARQEQSRALEAWAGRAVSPFRPEEAATLAGMLTAMQPAAQVAAIKTLATAIPPRQMRAVAAQMGRDGPSALASIALHAANETGANRNVGELIARGANLISTGSVKMDTAKETGVRSQIRELIRGTYATMAEENMAVEDAFRIAATFHSEGRDSANRSNIQNAVDLATGGIYEHTGGARVAKPYGWSDANMRDAMAAQVPARIEAAAGGRPMLGDRPIAPDDLYRQRRLWQLGTTQQPGAYTVSIGGRMVTRPDGRPLILPFVEP
jgi:hypothetical protein